MAFGMQLMRCIPAVFWKTGRYNAPVSTRTETDGFMGFSGSDRHNRKGNGVQIGRIFPQVTYLCIPGVSDER
jgi:hypothetical protein